MRIGLKFKTGWKTEKLEKTNVDSFLRSFSCRAREKQGGGCGETGVQRNFFFFFFNTVGEIAACLYTSVSEPLEGEMLQEKGDNF